MILFFTPGLGGFTRFAWKSAKGAGDSDHAGAQNNAAPSREITKNRISAPALVPVIVDYCADLRRKSGAKPEFHPSNMAKPPHSV
ncbi:hypothetical protein [Pseudosulfitobacter sp. DSM 107133]|uniref:hypothetical protein n=1 Tax=Pseudosulfitobacter sp. DSM 107133 TaxID=2883100 RepID=UPI001F073A40|nr:hypothetical protein [Pseudosulfitobacter sp. DSM 107133]